MIRLCHAVAVGGRTLGGWGRCLSVAILLLLPFAGVLQAQQLDRGRDGVEFEAFAGVYLPGTLTLAPGETEFQLEDQELILGGRFGYTFGFNLFLQADVSYIPLTMTFPSTGTEMNLNTWMWTGTVGYNLQIMPAAQLFVLAGGGLIQWFPNGLATETQPTAHFGGGVRIYLTPGIAIRAEVRDHLLQKNLTQTRESLSPGITVEDELTHNLEISGGVSLFFGLNRDSDGDGVYNNLDVCPDTPSEVAADAKGCPLDGDGDGVPDYRDRCRLTPSGTLVNQEGCPLDSDGDGVSDDIDRCPNTPAGVTVDEFGCPLDADGDGVYDGVDRCPNTPAGAMVDEFGCPLDTDGDGVYDGIDQCPNTPADREVDENGCSRIQAGLEAGRLVLSSVYFQTNSANLLPQSRRILDEVGAALVDRPELRIEIQGYTDSSGAAGYNLNLSDQRARSVFDHLVATFPALDRTRFTVRGYGEANPIATNDTADGRSLNRRVEFVVLNQQ